MFPLLMRSWSSMELTRTIKVKRKNEILICFTNLSEHTKGAGHLSPQGVMGCCGTSHSTATHPRGVWAKLTHRDGCCWRNSCWNWRWDSPLPVPINKTEIYCACVFKFTLDASKMFVSSLNCSYQLVCSRQNIWVWWDLNLSHFITLYNNLWYATCVTEHTGIWLPKNCRNLDVSHSVCIAN